MFGRTPNKYMLFVVKQAFSRVNHRHMKAAHFLSSCLSRENIKKNVRAAWERGNFEHANKIGDV